MDGMIDYGKCIKSGLLAFLKLAMDFAIGHLSSPQKSWKILPSGIPKTETGFEFRCMNEIAMDKFESE